MNEQKFWESARVLNRDSELPADRWYQISPLGEYWALVGDGEQQDLALQILDEQAMQAIVESFAKMRADAGDAWAGIRIDIDHISEGSGPTESQGWIMDLQARPDGLYALIDWSDTGEAAVKGKRFKFVSPTWFFDVIKQINAPSWWTGTKVVNAIRPMAIDYVALTNKHRLIGLKPLSNRGGAALESNPRATKGKDMEHRTMLLTILGLKPEATDAEIQTAADNIQTVRNSQQDELTQLKAKVKTFEDAALETKVQAALEKYGPRIKNRDDMAARLRKDYEGAIAILDGLADAPPPRRVLNREDGKVPAGDQDAEALSVARTQYVDEVMAKQKIHNRADAWAMAATQRPELFGK